MKWASSNPYAELGIGLHEIDLFYHYQVERRDNILRLFAQYGRVGAHLLFVRSVFDTATTPSNIDEIAQWNGLYLYRKEAMIAEILSEYYTPALLASIHFHTRKTCR